MKINKIITIIFLAIIIPLITACSLVREQLTFNGKEGKISFSVKKKEKYKISTKNKDFRTSREQGIIVGKDFEIGIEFNDDFAYFFKGDFNKVKKARKNNENYKEVTYSSIKGIEYFYPGYMRYNVILPIKENNKYYILLTIYGKHANKKSAEEAMNNKDVLDILNHITELKIK